MMGAVMDATPAVAGQPTEHGVRWLLQELVNDVLATGSRVICPQSAAQDADYDFVAEVSDLKQAVSRLIAHGFKAASSLNGDNDAVITVGTKFVSLKQGSLNIIAVQDREFFDKFGLATRIATKLGLVVKSHRILLFRSILYGEG